MLGLDQAAGHGKAHLAQADESDIHDGLSLKYFGTSLRGAKRRSNPAFSRLAWIASLRSQ
jgi:hypothetical protein